MAKINGISKHILLIIGLIIIMINTTMIYNLHDIITCYFYNAITDMKYGLHYCIFFSKVLINIRLFTFGLLSF